MNLRTDSANLAGWHRAMLKGALERKPDEDWTHTLAVPPAELGDVWRAGVGYALTCPNDCDQGVHVWDHAWDCRPNARKCTGAGCWSWTGSPEAGDLTAQPSLHVLAEKGGCGWHGWLRNGEMVSV